MGSRDNQVAAYQDALATQPWERHGCLLDFPLDLVS
jgi:hypothetical protein